MEWVRRRCVEEAPGRKEQLNAAGGIWTVRLRPIKLDTLYQDFPPKSSQLGTCRPS